MTPIEALYKELKSDLLAELKNSFMEEIQPKIKDLIRESILETKPIEDYQLVEWFTNRYHISKRTFHKYKNLGYVDSKQVGRFKIYNVKLWIENLNKIKSGMPDFLKVPLGKVG